MKNYENSRGVDGLKQSALRGGGGGGGGRGDNTLAGGGGGGGGYGYFLGPHINPKSYYAKNKENTR